MAHDVPLSGDVADQAALWAVRTGDPAFVAWEEFSTWLAADSRHAETYDRIVAAVEDVAHAQLPPAPAPAEETDNVVHLHPARRQWLGGALAACVAGALAVGAWQLRDQGDVYQTAPGEIRELVLADGSKVVLGGGTKLAIKRGTRGAEIESGQALFTVHHDQAHPFTVTAGGDTLVDVGTVFDVRRQGGSLTVAVAEGAVVFNPKREAVRIDPGHRLVSRDGTVELAETPTEQVGEWRKGRLTFHDSSLDDVAADLTRASGIVFEVAASASPRRVSGSVLVDPVRRDPAKLGPLLGVRLQRSARGWSIEP